MSRSGLSDERIGEIAAALAYAALDTGETLAVLFDAWPQISAAMPLALDFCSAVVAARPVTAAKREHA